MFTSDSDFEVDEEFLETVLSNAHCSLSTRHEVLEAQQSDSNLSHGQCDGDSEQTLNWGKQVKGKKGCKSDFIKRSSSDSSVKNVFSHTPGKKIFLETSIISRSAERKFPGPAGLLPDKGIASPDCNFSPINSVFKGTTPCNKEQHFTVQNWQMMLERETWKRVLVDIGNLSCGNELLKNINIKSIKEKASARLLVNKKIPFLAVIVQDVSSSSPDPYITLCDQTGIMNGTLHRDVWKQFGEDLVSSSVLLLRNVGVFSFGLKSYKNQHYLNITSNNLVSLYTYEEGAVKVTNIQPVTNEEVFLSLKKWHSNNTTLQKPDESSPTIVQQLFSSHSFSDFNTDDSSVFELRSSHQHSPLPGRSRQDEYSTPVSSRTSIGNKKSSNVLSPITSRQNIFQKHTQNMSSLLRVGTGADTGEYRNITSQENLFSVRDSSAILNLITGRNDCTVSSLKTNINEPKDNIKNVINTNNGCNARNFCDSSKRINSSSILYTGNSVNNFMKNKLQANLANSSVSDNNAKDFIHPFSLNSFSFNDMQNRKNSFSETEFETSQKNIKINNIDNRSHIHFTPKKPRTDSLQIFNNYEKKDIACVEKIDNATLNKQCYNNTTSNEMRFGDRKTTVKNCNNYSYVKETDFVQSQVESVLEGLDVNSFLDDDF